MHDYITEGPRIQLELLKHKGELRGKSINKRELPFYDGAAGVPREQLKHQARQGVYILKEYI